MVSLAVATLLANGDAEPRRHLFLAAAGNVATLIVTKSPLSVAALAALKDLPYHRQSEPNRAAGDVGRLAAHAGLDHRAPSADRPGEAGLRLGPETRFI